MLPSVSIWNEDCIQGATRLADESCDLFVSSIPFGALFQYSGKTEDIGNNQDGVDMDEGQFGLHMRFFIEQLYRVLKPGSLACIHVQQLICYKVQHGFMGMRDFCGAVVRLFKRHGFQPHGEVAIVKNPQAVAKRLNLHSLMFVTASRDARALAPAMNDYVLIFKKPGEGVPVKGCVESQRDVWLVEPSPIIEYIDGGKIKRIKPDYQSIPYEIRVFEKNKGYETKTVTGGEGINPQGWFTKQDWVKWAHGCWDDILEIDVLSGWKGAKEEETERHVCPLQLEVIRRCIKMYSNPRDTVDDWFMGIGSTAAVAIEQDRNCRGFELKESYHRMALANSEGALFQKQMSLF